MKTVSPIAERARWRADLMLVGAALLFGSTFLVVKHGVEDADPVPFLGARYVIATLVLWPVARRRPRSVESDATIVRDGVLAGVALGVAYVLQTWGLEHTTSARSAFITYLLVVIVPVLSALFLRRPPHRLTVFGVALAVFGLSLLTGGAGGGLGLGEVLTLGCAFAFAVHLLIVAEVASRHDAFRLTLIQLATIAASCGIGGLFLGGYSMPAVSWGAAAVTGVAATAVAFVLMVSAQQVVGPTRAAIILLIEPVSAGVLGAVTGEAFGWRGAAGAMLILAAVVVVEVLPQVRHQPPETD